MLGQGFQIEIASLQLLTTTAHNFVVSLLTVDGATDAYDLGSQTHVPYRSPALS